MSPTRLTGATLLKTVVDEFGGLDILVNNAGIASFGHFAESSEAILRQIMEVNFFAPTELIRLAIPVLDDGPTAGHREYRFILRPARIPCMAGVFRE